MRRGNEEVCVLEIVRPGMKDSESAEKTGKYRDRTSQRVPRRKRRGKEKGCLYGELCSTRCPSSSFETHRSALRLWKRLRSSCCDAPQHEGEGRRTNLRV